MEMNLYPYNYPVSTNLTGYYRADQGAQNVPMTQSPYFPTGGSSLPMRRGLAAVSYHPYRSLSPMQAQRNAWSPYGMAGFGGNMGGRPQPGFGGFGGFGSGPGRPGARPKPNLDPEKVKKFLSDGVGRVNAIMSGIDKVSKTVQQLSPLVQMMQGLNSSSSTSGSGGSSTVDIEPQSASAPAAPRRRSSGARRSGSRRSGRR